MIYLKKFLLNTNESKRQVEKRIGKELLKEALKKEYGLIYEELQISRKEHGKPYIENVSGVYYNISHSEGIVACLLHSSDVGIDIEQIRPFSERVARRVFTEKEIKYLQEETENEKVWNERCFSLWTLKESYVKAIGDGLRMPLRKVEFDIGGINQIDCNQSGYYFHQYKIGEYLLSVCTKEDLVFKIHEI